MADWPTSEWASVLVWPAAIAAVGAVANRADLLRSRVARLEETSRLLALATKGSHDEHLLRLQLETGLAREVDRREVRMRAGWRRNAWWFTALLLLVANLIAMSISSPLPEWWRYGYFAAAVLGIAIPNGQIAPIEIRVRQERERSEPTARDRGRESAAPRRRSRPSK